MLSVTILPTNETPETRKSNIENFFNTYARAFEIPDYQGCIYNQENDILSILLEE